MPDLTLHSCTFRHRVETVLPLMLALAAFTSTGTADAAVIHCRDEAGRMHFRQFGCPSGAIPITPDANAGERLSVVATAPLSPAEQSALAELERSLERDRQSRARAQARAARERSARAAADAQRCREAEQKLARLAETRRKGYRATAEAKLESEEAHWRATRKATC